MFISKFTLAKVNLDTISVATYTEFFNHSDNLFVGGHRCIHNALHLKGNLCGILDELMMHEQLPTSNEDDLLVGMLINAH